MSSENSQGFGTVPPEVYEEVTKEGFSLPPTGRKGKKKREGVIERIRRARVKRKQNSSIVVGKERANPNHDK